MNGVFLFFFEKVMIDTIGLELLGKGFLWDAVLFLIIFLLI